MPRDLLHFKFQDKKTFSHFPCGCLLPSEENPAVPKKRKKFALKTFSFDIKCSNFEIYSKTLLKSKKKKIKLSCLLKSPPRANNLLKTYLFNTKLQSRAKWKTAAYIKFTTTTHKITNNLSTPPPNRQNTPRHAH